MKKNRLICIGEWSITSGEDPVSIVSIEHCEECNSGSELKLGSAVASYITATIFTPNNEFSISDGTEFGYYVTEGTNYEIIGLYTAERPKRTSRNMLKIIAYDRMVRFDIDITSWIAGNNFSGKTLFELLQWLCRICGVVLKNESIPNGDYIIDDFNGEMTGRQLLQYIAEVAGCFARITADGKLELAWYQENTYGYNVGFNDAYDSPVELADGSELYTSDGLQFVGKTESAYYFMNSLSFDDYYIRRITGIKIQNSEDEEGYIYRSDLLGAGNTYRILKNPLLSNMDPNRLEPVAQTIVERLWKLHYIPAKVTIPATWDVRAGDAIHIDDVNGRAIYTLAMSCKRKGQKLTIQSKGMKEEKEYVE